MNPTVRFREVRGVRRVRERKINQMVSAWQKNRIVRESLEKAKKALADATAGFAAIDELEDGDEDRAAEELGSLITDIEDALEASQVAAKEVDRGI